MQMVAQAAIVCAADKCTKDFWSSESDSFGGSKGVNLVLDTRWVKSAAWSQLDNDHHRVAGNDRILKVCAVQRWPFVD